MKPPGHPPSRGEVTRTSITPANTSQPLFWGAQKLQQPVSLPFPVILSHAPFFFLKHKTSPTTHLFLNLAKAKQGPGSSFLPRGLWLQARRGGRSTRGHHPAAARGAPAEQSEGRRAGSPCKVCPVLSNNTRCHCIPKSVPGALFITTETQNPAGQRQRRERESGEGRGAGGRNLPMLRDSPRGFKAGLGLGGFQGATGGGK